MKISLLPSENILLIMSTTSLWFLSTILHMKTGIKQSVNVVQVHL